jgi:hypothetical protein
MLDADLEKWQASRRQAEIERERSIQLYERIIAEHPDEFDDEFRALVASMRNPPRMPPCISHEEPRDPVRRMVHFRAKWQGNEMRLNRFYAMPESDRERRGEEIERLEAAQDRIEFELGCYDPTMPDF